MNGEIMLHRRTIVILRQVREVLALAEVPALLAPVDALITEHQSRVGALTAEAFDSADTAPIQVSR